MVRRAMELRLPVLLHCMCVSSSRSFVQCRFRRSSPSDSIHCCYNICRVHGTLRRKPAMAVGLTAGPWSMDELLTAACA